MKEVILKLHSIGAIKIGNFEIKKDFYAPFFVDFSGMISHPQLAKNICSALWEKASHLTFQLIAGVPTIGSCLANYLAWQQDVPFVTKWHHVKETEMAAKIAGMYKSGQRALVIQDYFLAGQHTLDMVKDLEDEGIEARDILAVIDLNLGERKKLKSHGYVAHSLIGIEDVVQILYDAGKIPGDVYKLTLDFLESNPHVH